MRPCLNSVRVVDCVIAVAVSTEICVDDVKAPGDYSANKNGPPHYSEPVEIEPRSIGIVYWFTGTPPVTALVLSAAHAGAVPLTA